MSAGRFRIIVESAAYENVATAKQAASAYSDVDVDRRNQEQHPERADDDHQLPRRADSPAARDENARYAAAGEVAEVRGDKRHPEREQAVLER